MNMRKVHLIAIGGSVMHNLALALHQDGVQVTGSDDEIANPAKDRLAAAGLLPQALGWHTERITPDLDAVILGMHAREDNPELRQALALNLPVFSFPEFIYHHCRNKQRVVIAGSHGKTTITSIILHILKSVGKDADYLVGAQLKGFDTMVRLTAKAPVIILEGDEYATSPLDKRPKFAHYHPHILALSGIAWDHVNIYPTEEGYVAQFANLLQDLAKSAMCVYNKDDKQVRELANKYLRKEFHFIYPYTIVHNPIGQIGVKGTGQKIYKTRDGVTEIKLDGMKLTTRLLGKHNVSNIAAAWQVCELLAVTKDEFAQHLATFEGAALRMERVHESPKLVVVRDFAHAPSKVQASVDAMAEAYKGHDLTAVLELHTYSSLNANFIGQYQGALKKAKHKIVLVDKHALELKKMPPLSEDDVKRAFGDKGIVFVETLAQLQQALSSRANSPQALLLMSSGRLAGLDLNSLWT